MFRPRRFALALIAVSAVALAACDGDTAENNDYVDQVNEVSSTLLTSVQSLPATGGSPKQISAALERVSAEVGTAATDLDGIEPPEDVASLHDEIVTDLNTLKDEATNAANEVSAGGAAGRGRGRGPVRRRGEPDRRARSTPRSPRSTRSCRADRGRAGLPG